MLDDVPERLRIDPPVLMNYDIAEILYRPPRNGVVVPLQVLRKLSDGFANVLKIENARLDYEFVGEELLMGQ